MQRIQKILTVATIASFISLAFMLGIALSMPTLAQVEPNSRYFLKDFCAEQRDTLSGITYTNGQEISYSEGGCPSSSIVISGWNDISIANKQIITNRLAIDGYTDVTSQLSSLVN